MNSKKAKKQKNPKTVKTQKTEKEPTTSVLLKAIHTKCLDCSGTKTEVGRCSIKGCALWKWRKELEEKK